jgi:glycosyltransferase involved in cell wall biosynthesis
LVPVGDEVAMASAILETIEDSLPPDALRDRASKFSVSNAVDEYTKIIQEIEK